MKRPRSPFAVGLVVLVVIGVLVFLGFTKDIPFINEPYQIKAAFRDTSGMKAHSPVRIAGVEVGEVTKVEHTKPGAQSATVTLAIKNGGRPIHRDARAEIRPRIFLEGDFFVDLKPGTSSAPELKDGGSLPIGQTSNPVQLDEVLRALNVSVRQDFQTIVEELATAQRDGAGKEFAKTYSDQAAAYRYTAIVSEALLGEKPGDLARLIDAGGTVAGAIDAHPPQLRSLITDFNTTAAALADRDEDLSAAVGELPVTLKTALPAFADINAALPDVRRLARAARPAVRSTGPTARASTPLVRQLRGLVGADELGGLSSDLRKATPPLAQLSRDSVPALEELRAGAGCTEEVLVPWGNDKVPDPNFPAKGPVYEQIKFTSGLAGESRGFDANGQFFKVLGAGGVETVSLGKGLLGQASQPIVGVNPPPDRTRPPFRRDVACETQPIPDLRTKVGAPPQQRKTGGDQALVSERTGKARDVAIAFMRDALKREGSKLKIADADLTLKQLQEVAQKTGRTAALRQAEKAVGK